MLHYTSTTAQLADRYGPQVMVSISSEYGLRTGHQRHHLRAVAIAQPVLEMRPLSGPGVLFSSRVNPVQRLAFRVPLRVVVVFAARPSRDAKLIVTRSLFRASQTSLVWSYCQIYAYR